MTTARGIALALFGALAAAGAAGTWAWHDRPDLAAWRALPAPGPPPAPGDVTVTHMGVTTLLFRDGETALLTDGFFSRPPAWKVATGWPVEPDAERIEAALAAVGRPALAAVMTLHSHYDHAMDAPEVARRTGAQLVGTVSTLNAGRGAGLPEERLVLASPDAPLHFGAFTVRFVPSRHVPLATPGADAMAGDIDAPLVPPAPVSAWREGGCLSIVVSHPQGTALVQGSAGFVPGALAGVGADVVFLGVGGLGGQEPGYRDAYWSEVVEAVGARRVVPVHWDDFTTPLEPPLRALPRLLDDLEGGLAFVAARAEATPGVELRWPVPLSPAALYR